MTARRHRHPKEAVEPLEDGRAQCGDCGRVFVPRFAPKTHGNYRGYMRHSKLRTGEWAWPPCEPCAQAGREWRREHERQPGVKDSRRNRGRAKEAAFLRLKHAYPGLFARFYAQELEAAGGRLRVLKSSHAVPDWDDAMARLVKAATGMDEFQAGEHVVAGRADPLTREVVMMSRRLRVYFEQMGRQEENHDGED